MVCFAICDDDKEFADRFIKIIKRDYGDELEHFGGLECQYYSSSAELIGAYKESNIDVVFMDIEVGSEKGFDIAKQLVKTKENLGLVYVTSYESYVIEAYSCRPLGFIRKDKLDADMRRTWHEVGQFLNKRKVCFDFLDGNKVETVMLERVRTIKMQGHMMILKFENRDIQIRDTVKRVENELEKYDFVKIDRGVLVNLQYIRKVENKNCYMYNDEIIAISRYRISEVNEIIRKYNKMKQ